MRQNRGDLHRQRLEALATSASITTKTRRCNGRGCGPPWKPQAPALAADASIIQMLAGRGGVWRDNGTGTT